MSGDDYPLLLPEVIERITARGQSVDDAKAIVIRWVQRALGTTQPERCGIFLVDWRWNPHCGSDWIAALHQPYVHDPQYGTRNRATAIRSHIWIDWDGSKIAAPYLDEPTFRWTPILVSKQVLDHIGVPLTTPETTSPVAPVLPRAAVPAEGGRPTDRDSVIAEAKRRLSGDKPIPSTLKAFANQLHNWLDKQPDAVRAQKTGQVMSSDTIEAHVRSVWANHRGG
jgi:hypothetical protein